MKNKTEEMQNIVVQLLNINGDVKQYDDVKFIKIRSKKYNLIIMKDYLPIIGEIQGNIEIGREKEKIFAASLLGFNLRGADSGIRHRAHRAVYAPALAGKHAGQPGKRAAAAHRGNRRADQNHRIYANRRIY